jgi:hypothetical protein
VRSMIRDGKTHQIISVIQTGQRHGMQSLEQALTRLVMQGLVDKQVAAQKLAALGLAREEETGQRAAHAEEPPSQPPLGAQPQVGRPMRSDSLMLERSKVAPPLGGRGGRGE